MRTILYYMFCISTFFVSSALHVHAEELEGNPITVKGLVVSSGHGLVINDGVRDYLLLGVDTTDYEGLICEATGTLKIENDMQAIQVKTLRIVAKEYPDEDLVGSNWGVGSPGTRLLQSDTSATALESPSVEDTCWSSLGLPIWDGSGMRILAATTPSVDSHAASSAHQ